MLDVIVGGVSVSFAEGCVGEVHLTVVDGFFLCVCCHGQSLNGLFNCLNGLFNGMITYKLYY